MEYAGAGAYFLDKLDDGVWRLEVMPDALWVRDPFFVPSVRREAAVTLSREHPMIISLPDLQGEFRIMGLNDGNLVLETAEDGSFNVSPGAYLLRPERNRIRLERGKQMEEFATQGVSCPGPET